MNERIVEVMKARQRAWMESQRLNVDNRGYTRTITENLFQKLHLDTEEELKSGAGDELGTDARPGKIAAPDSSAALVCNMFDYWRAKGPSLAASACGAGPGITAIRFEQTFPTGLGGEPPHLDIVFSGSGRHLTAIESKFLEPYRHRDCNRALKPSYVRTSGLWEDLPSCEKLATAFHQGDLGFKWLDGHQLLKHVLGLRKARARDEVRLLYLWYDVGGAIAKEHREEIDSFKHLLGSDIEFDASTHQEIFARLLPHLGHHAEYRDYLQQRYFGTSS